MRILGRYELRGEIGRGTMGVVYRGYDPVLDRELAVKTISLPDALELEKRKNFLDRFLLEARIAAKLIHPNIVITHDAATDEGSGIPFIAMELVEGDALSSVLKREGRMSWERALQVGVSLAKALAYAHENQVVHRDIKPANVLLSNRGSAKLADFGIAKLPSGELTQTGVVIGTPYYMAPEQLTGDEVDGRSDVFALGATLYTMIAGERPFEGQDLAAISHQVIYKQPRPLSERVDGVPELVDGVLAGAMHKDRTERYTAEDLAADLTALLEGREPHRALPLGEKTLEHDQVPTTREMTPASPVEPASEQAVPAAATPSTSHASRKVTAAALLLTGLALGWLYSRTSGSSAHAMLASAGDWLRQQSGQLERAYEVRREEQDHIEELRRQGDERWRRTTRLTAQGKWEAAEGEIQAALEAYQRAGDGGGEARALLARGRLNAERGSWSKARADFDASSAVGRIYDLPEAQSRAFAERAHLEADLGRFEVASSFYAKTATPPEPVGGEQVLGRGELELFQGRSDEAKARWEAVLGGSESSPKARGRAAQLLGQLSAWDGDTDGAEMFWKQARHFYQQDDLVDHAASLSLWEGHLALALGDMDKASTSFANAESAFRDASHSLGLLAALEGRYGLSITAQQTAEAERLLAEVSQWRDRLGLDPFELDVIAPGEGELRTQLARAFLRTPRSRQRRQRWLELTESARPADGTHE